MSPASPSGINPRTAASVPAGSAAAIKRVLPWVVAVAFFMEALDTTILNTAVPTIAGALHVGALSMKSALTSYTLSLAVFIPVSGWVADRFGTRRVFSTAIAIFTLGSLFCGLTTSITMLVVARVIQGCGGAMMVPVGRLTMVRTFERSELVRAMSFVVIPGLIGPLVGPLLGGLIVGYFHWRVIFFVNLPIGLTGLYLVYRYLPDFRAEKSDPLDLVGLILFGAGVGLLSYVLEVFGDHNLPLSAVLGLFVIALGLLLGYVFHAREKPRPLLRLRLFRIRTFRAAVVGGFVTRLGIGGMPFLLPLVYQIGLGYTPVQAGLLIMPQPLAAMLLKLVVTRVLARFGYRVILLGNTVVIGGFIMLFATISRHTPVWVILGQMFCFGLVSSMQYTCMNSLVYADITNEDTSMASSISSTAQQMSISFGIALASLATALFTGGSMQPGSELLIASIRRTFLVLGSLTIACAWLFRELRPHDGDAVSQTRKASVAAQRATNESR